MKICPNCHAQLDDSSIFCTSCGTQFGAVPPQQNAIPPQQNAVPPQQNAVPPQQNAIPPQQNAVPPQPAFAPAYDPYDHTAEFDPKDISDNKVFAMLCYLMDFIGIIVALLATHSSKYTMFHVRQALKITVHILCITQLRALKNTRSFFCKPQINILEIRTD